LGEIPKTRSVVPIHEQDRLRNFVRTTELMGGRIAGARVATPGDAAALSRLLSDPSIAPWIYTLPNPITTETMAAFIDDHLEQRSRGAGVLFVSLNPAGEATAYFDVELWPHWSACKFGGAVKPERQGRGFGGACGLAAVEWCLDHLRVDRICQTTALDNDRSIRINARLGMVRMGEVLAVRPDGTTRPSLYWELERERWEALKTVRRAS